MNSLKLRKPLRTIDCGAPSPRVLKTLVATNDHQQELILSYLDLYRNPAGYFFSKNSRKYYGKCYRAKNIDAGTFITLFRFERISE